MRNIALLGNHLPRQCGIATFTTDLGDAISSEFPHVRCSVVAMNDVGVKHAYPSRVRFEIPEGDIEAYRRAADFLNVNSVDVLSVQHEYGIFGGKAGGHVLEMLRHLRMPVVTTLHTIMAEPGKDQRAVMDALIGLSERLIVMSGDGAALLQEVHGVDPEKIDVIPHGIPLVATDSNSKGKIGVDGPVLLTFGLLSPDKGIEYVIDAMPAILKRHPSTMYIVLGATHPHVKQEHGEAYRLMLQMRAERLGVDENVIFHNRFVSREEVVEFLGAADLYITPYLKEQQSTSGTLAYAIGAGKAVISTPYRYARELLADERGILVPWRDAQAVAREAVGLLDDRSRRGAIERRAAQFGLNMRWPVVARRYVACFNEARVAFERRSRAGQSAQARLARRHAELPEIDLSHVRLMTDDTGILQHAIYDVPRRSEGYCIDDNARALLLMTHVEEAHVERHQRVRMLATRYLAFVANGLDEKTGRFNNFLTYARQWHEGPGSDDSHGRTLWALGTVVGRSTDPGRKALSHRLFDRALPAARSLGSPRGWAYTLLGIAEYLRAVPFDVHTEAVRAELTSRLCERYEHSSREGWPWFEDRLTYCNARMPQALLVSAARMGDDQMMETAIRSLEWLATQQVAADGTFMPVGTNGFYVRGGPRAQFDQQPVEACAMVSACLDAHRITSDVSWLERARHAFQWFLGQNSQGALVYDARTGGCRDGIHLDRVNENQGAESTLSFLTALAELRAADRLTTRPPAAAQTVPAKYEGSAELAIIGSEILL